MLDISNIWSEIIKFVNEHNGVLSFLAGILSGWVMHWVRIYFDRENRQRIAEENSIKSQKKSSIDILSMLDKQFCKASTMIDRNDRKIIVDFYNAFMPEIKKIQNEKLKDNQPGIHIPKEIHEKFNDIAQYIGYVVSDVERATQEQPRPEHYEECMKQAKQISSECNSMIKEVREVIKQKYKINLDS